MKQIHWKRMKTQNLNSMENPSRVVMVYVVSPALVTTAMTDMIRKMVCGIRCLMQIHSDYMTCASIDVRATRIPSHPVGRGL